MTKFSFVGLRKYWFALSGMMIVASLVGLAVFGLRFSIDFTGGSLLEIGYAKGAPDTAEAGAVLTAAGIDGASIQSADFNHKLIIRTAALSEEQHQAALAALQEKFGDGMELRFDSIGPTIGKELRRSATIGVAVTLLLIGLYITWAFRKVSEPIASWKYGLLTMLTAAHDVVVPLGVFAVLGRFYGWEVGAAFVAAMLTILGYSISDTVVVFDRTRENLLAHSGEPFGTVVERSIKQTFVRSLNTSLTTVIALLAILFLGGDSTRPFALALIVGIAVGTYSSIFIASPALVEWESRRKV
jgi:preprotein translocase subunit SecF